MLGKCKLSNNKVLSITFITGILFYFFNSLKPLRVIFFNPSFTLFCFFISLVLKFNNGRYIGWYLHYVCDFIFFIWSSFFLLLLLFYYCSLKYFHLFIDSFIREYKEKLDEVCELLLIVDPEEEPFKSKYKATSILVCYTSLFIVVHYYLILITNCRKIYWRT